MRIKINTGSLFSPLRAMSGADELDATIVEDANGVINISY
jgi:hypothetical protein